MSFVKDFIKFKEYGKIDYLQECYDFEKILLMEEQQEVQQQMDDGSQQDQNMQQNINNMEQQNQQDPNQQQNVASNVKNTAKYLAQRTAEKATKTTLNAGKECLKLIKDSTVGLKNLTNKTNDSPDNDESLKTRTTIKKGIRLGLVLATTKALAYLTNPVLGLITGLTGLMLNGKYSKKEVSDTLQMYRDKLEYYDRRLEKCENEEERYRLTRIKERLVEDIKKLEKQQSKSDQRKDAKRKQDELDRMNIRNARMKAEDREKEYKNEIY